jgi:hypothetical protein
MHHIVQMDMKTAQLHSLRVKAIIIAYSLSCFLLYAIGAAILDSSPANAIGRVIIVFSGLLLIFTGPGLFIAFSCFRRKYSLAEYIIIGIAVNLVLFPAILALIKLAGIPITAALAVSAIALLTVIAAAVWIGLDRPSPSPGEIVATLSRLSLSALCLLAIVLAYPREVLTPVDRFISNESFVEFVDLLAAHNKVGLASGVYIERPGQLSTYKGSAPHDLTWVYINNTSQPQQFAAMVLTNCGWLQLSQSQSKPVEGGPATGKNVQIDELWRSPSLYFTFSGINPVFLDDEFPDRNRVYASEEIALLPGQNFINVRCLEAQNELRILDLSTMDRAQLIDILSKNYFIKAEPEVGDAQEAFLESKYALDAISWINPPLLYPIYRGTLEVLGMSMSSITLLDIFAFSFVFMVLCIIITESPSKFLPIHYSIIVLVVLINYVIAITSLPVLHSAGGVFLLLFLAGSWFLWRRAFVPAAGALILMCLIRYEGLVLASLLLFAFFAVADHQIRIRNYVLSALAAVSVLSFLVVWTWGAAVFQTEALVERVDMLRLTDISPQRVWAYLQWALIVACAMPIFWTLTRKTDRLSAYYLLVAVLYFGFLCTLDYIRPYHLGPFVLAATIAGTRAIMGVGDATVRKTAIAIFFALAIGSLYLVLYHLPRQLPALT